MLTYKATKREKEFLQPKIPELGIVNFLDCNCLAGGFRCRTCLNENETLL